MNNAFSPQQPQPQSPDRWQQLMSVISLFHPDELQRLLPLMSGAFGEQAPNVDLNRDRIDREETALNLHNMLNRGMTPAPGFGNAMAPTERFASPMQPLYGPDRMPNSARPGAEIYSMSGPFKQRVED